MFPPYVLLGDTALRLKQMEDKSWWYYRDAGCWAVGASPVGETIEGHKLLTSISSERHLHGRELIETTEDVWRESNKGYV